MNAETNRALEIIRRTANTLPLITITGVFPKGILEELTQFAFDQSNAKHLRQTVCHYAIHILGLGKTTNEINLKAKELFHLFLNDYFPEITSSQAEALFQTMEQAADSAPM